MKVNCLKQLPCKRYGYTNPKDCNSCLCPDGFSGRLCEKVAQPNGELNILQQKYKYSVIKLNIF